MRTPSDTLCKRLDELSKAVTQGRESVAREFTMRVPAEPDRDADLVLSSAAERIRELETINADLYSALLSAEQSIVTFMRVHGYSNESGAGYILAEVKTALAKARGEQ